VEIKSPKQFYFGVFLIIIGLGLTIFNAIRSRNDPMQMIALSDPIAAIVFYKWGIVSEKILLYGFSQAFIVLLGFIIGNLSLESSEDE